MEEFSVNSSERAIAFPGGGLAMLAPQATTRPRQPPKMIFICKLRLFELRGPQAQISALHLLRINAVCKTARAVASPGRRLAALTPQATTHKSTFATNSTPQALHLRRLAPSVRRPQPPKNDYSRKMRSAGSRSSPPPPAADCRSPEGSGSLRWRRAAKTFHV